MQARGACTMLENRAVLTRDRGEEAMRWRGERESENVEDRRDEGGGFGFPFPGGGVRLSERRLRPRRRHRHSRHSHHSRPDVLLRRRPERDPARRTSRRRQRSELPRYPAAAVAARHHQFPDARAAAGTADRASQDHQRGRSQALRVGGSRRHRGCLAGHLRALWRALQRSQAGAVHRRRALGLRLRGWRRWGRSTARTTRRSISTSTSTRS